MGEGKACWFFLASFPKKLAINWVALIASGVWLMPALEFHSNGFFSAID